MSAWASPDTRVSARKNTSIAMAERTPMSLHPRRPVAELLGLLGRPAEQLHQRRPRAPRTARSSAVVIAALCSADSRWSAPTLAPTRRAGITNSGSSTSASTRDLPRQPEHHDQGERQGDDVGDDAGRGPR